MIFAQISISSYTSALIRLYRQQGHCMGQLSSGLIFEVPSERAEQITLLRFLKGLKEEELFFIKGVVALCLSESNNRTSLKTLTEYFENQGKKNSFNTLKVKARNLAKLNIFSTTYEPRERKRPAAIYRLNDISKLLDQPSLSLEPISSKKKGSRKKAVLYEQETHLLGNKNFPITYSRKINHIIMRRCTNDETFLGKKIAIHLPGYNETVQVIQRTASGIPPMDGSEDRLQQALLTMFKQNLKHQTQLEGKQFLTTVQNSFLIDMREVCQSMQLKPSSGNIQVQAKKLYQLRFNTFEIHFDPEGIAAQSFNMLCKGDSKLEYYRNKEEKKTYQLFSDRLDQYFLKSLEPVRDQVISIHGEQKSLPFSEFKSKITDEDFKSGKEYLYDHTGRLFRFYRISFHDLVFDECLDEALGQIYIQPPSLLQEDRIIARQLTYLAQRVFGKTRDNPFEITWKDLCTELQPWRVEPKPFYQALTKVYNEELSRIGEQFIPEAGQKIMLHGYFFKTICSERMKRKRGQWRIRIWRDTAHPFTGDQNKARKNINDLKKIIN